MKKFKDIKAIKINPEPAKGKNVDPGQLGQYSAKYQVSEGGASLNQYLSSRGINPNFVSTATKIAHSKSSQFLKWQKDHMRNLRIEETDKKDMICMDIPLLIRVLEFTREDMKSDIQLHNMVERLINMRDNVPLDMTHYDAITSNLVKEETELEKKASKYDFTKTKSGKPAPKQTKPFRMGNEPIGKMKEEVEHLNEDETLKAIANKHGMKYHPGTYGANMSHPTKGYVNVNRYGEWGHYKQGRFDRGHGLATAHGDSSQHFKDLDKHLSTLKEEVLNEVKKPRTTALEKWRKAAAERENKHNQTKTKGMEDAITKLSQHLNKEEVELEEATGYEKTLKTTTYTPYKSHKGIEVSSKKAKTPKNLHQKYGEDYHIYHGTTKNKNGTGKEKSFVVHDRPLDVKFMHKHSDEEKEAILHHLNKNKHLDTSAFHKSQIPEEIELDEQINEVLSKDASAGDWIHDFVHSKNPKFAGKSTAERKKMALGAYYGKQNEENVEESVEDILKAVRGDKELIHKVSVNGQVKSTHRNKDSAKSVASALKSKFPHLKIAVHSIHEDMWQDPQAATQTPADGANGGNQVADRKRQMSKSARMIKSLYKRKGVVKEDMYDHEKEDKSVATYGKKPKMDQTDKKDSFGENKPQAAATLSGGTTLTGVKRDSIEIDPLMRNRPGQPDISKKSGKKEDNKNDK